MRWDNHTLLFQIQQISIRCSILFRRQIGETWSACGLILKKEKKLISFPFRCSRSSFLFPFLVPDEVMILVTPIWEPKSSCWILFKSKLLPYSRKKEIYWDKYPLLQGMDDYKQKIEALGSVNFTFFGTFLYDWYTFLWFILEKKSMIQSL
jgi:hypothetical protein